MQDVTFDYFVDLDAFGRGFYGDYEGKRLTPSMMLVDLDHFWKYMVAVDEKAVHANGGALGDLYDTGGEGDTPSFLNLIAANRGLSDIGRPAYGGWGDMFTKLHLPNVWFAETSRLDELMRWTRYVNNSFYARCRWEENDFASTNHDPIAAFDNDFSNGFVRLRKATGETVQLSAAGSFDPDGDDLSYRWFYYPEASSYSGEVAIDGSSSMKASFSVPSMDVDEEVHVVLEVSDHGDPSLVSYKRVIVTTR